MLKAGDTGRCPHCGVVVSYVGVSFTGARQKDDGDNLALWPAYVRPESRLDALFRKSVAIDVSAVTCTHCKRLVVTAEVEGVLYPVWPRVGTRAPVPEDVPDPIRDDFEEACLVLPDSPKASAAL